MVPLILYSRLAPTGAVIRMVTVGVAQVGCTGIVAAGVAGTANGAAVTVLLFILLQPPVFCITEYVPGVVTVLGFPVPPSLQVSVPVTPVAVITELPQLSVTVRTGAAGIDMGAAFIVLLFTLVQPPAVCVTVYVPVVVTVLGFPVPPSLHTSVPVTPVAVMIELPQLFTTVSTGAAGTGNGDAVTVLLTALGQPPTVCVTV